MVEGLYFSLPKGLFAIDHPAYYRRETQPVVTGAT